MLEQIWARGSCQSVGHPVPLQINDVCINGGPTIQNFDANSSSSHLPAGTKHSGPQRRRAGHDGRRQEAHPARVGEGSPSRWHRLALARPPLSSTPRRDQLPSDPQGPRWRGRAVEAGPASGQLGGRGTQDLRPGRGCPGYRTGGAEASAAFAWGNRTDSGRSTFFRKRLRAGQRKLGHPASLIGVPRTREEPCDPRGPAPPHPDARRASPPREGRSGAPRECISPASIECPEGRAPAPSDPRRAGARREPRVVELPVAAEDEALALHRHHHWRPGEAGTA